MAQYRIEATSDKNKQTVDNVAKPVTVNPGDEGDHPVGPESSVIPFPSPAEFQNQQAAEAQAAKFAEWLNHLDYNDAWDWVGKATSI